MNKFKDEEILDKVAQNYTQIDYSGLKHPIWTIFQNTTDYPEQYVARLFDLSIPTNVVMIDDCLDNLRQKINPLLDRYPRDEFDDKSVVEIYM